MTDEDHVPARDVSMVYGAIVALDHYDKTPSTAVEIADLLGDWDPAYVQQALEQSRDRGDVVEQANGYIPAPD